MIHDKVIEGSFVSLKPVTLEDAEFILKLRQRNDVSKYMHRVDISIEQQIQWIKTHQQIDGDYYFLIWNRNNERLGTISLYDKMHDHCEIGRAASIGNPIENVESFVLIYDFAFIKLGYKYLVGTVVPCNWRVKGMNLQFGFEYEDDPVLIDGMSLQRCQISKESYLARRPKIVELLKKAGKIVS